MDSSTISFRLKYKTKKGYNIAIKSKLYSVRIWTQALTSDWEGTYWKDKKKVLNDLRIKTAELNILYDELDLLTGIKNKRIML